MEDRNRELLAIIESQSQALESQRDEQRTLMNQVGSLQSEITMLRHSSAQYDVPIQDQNGTVDVSGLMQVMNSLKDEIKVLWGRHTRKKKHESYVDSRVAAPPEYAQSACAGYPPSQDPSPAHSMHSRHSKEPQKPNAAPQMFSLSTYSYLGNASTIELPGSSTQKGLDPPPEDSSSSSSSTSDRGHARIRKLEPRIRKLTGTRIRKQKQTRIATAPGHFGYPGSPFPEYAV